MVTRRKALATILFIGCAVCSSLAAAQANGRERMVLSATRWLDNNDCAFESEVFVNDKSLGVFQSTKDQDISELFKPGLNTVTFVTTAQPEGTTSNWIDFRIGPLTTPPRSTKPVISPVLLTFRNCEDWRVDDTTGKLIHPFGPNPKTPSKKNVRVSYSFYYAGVGPDRAVPKEGDYVLQAESWMPRNPSVVGTVSINGHMLGSFHGEKRALVISDHVKPGENELLITTYAVAGQLYDNDTAIEILGPLSYDITEQKFEGRQVISLKSMEGWERNKAGELQVKGKPGATERERVVKFSVDSVGN